MENTLQAHDKEQRRLEQKYRERKRSRGANEKMEEEPKTTIRVIPATISKTVLVKRADFYERNLGDVLTFWMFAEELAQVTDAGKQGYSNLRTIMRTAYDFGSRSVWISLQTTAILPSSISIYAQCSVLPHQHLMTI